MGNTTAQETPKAVQADAEGKDFKSVDVISDRPCSEQAIAKLQHLFEKIEQEELVRIKTSQLPPGRGLPEFKVECVSCGSCESPRQSMKERIASRYLCCKCEENIKSYNVDPELITALFEGKTCADFEPNCPCGDHHSKNENEWRWPLRGEGKDRDQREKDQGEYHGCIANRMWILGAEADISKCQVCKIFMPLYRTFGWTIRSFHVAQRHYPLINDRDCYYNFCIGCCKKLDTATKKKCPNDCVHFFCSRDCIRASKERHFVESHAFRCMRKACGKTQARDHFDEKGDTEFAACYDCHVGRYCSQECQTLDMPDHRKTCKNRNRY